VGSFFREDNVERPERVSVESPSPPVARSRFLVAGVAVVLVAALWPAWAARADNDAVELASSLTPVLPEALGDWAAVPMPPASWRPHYVGADVGHARSYERNGEHIGLHVACYAAQRQGAELVTSSNTLVAPEDSSWRRLGTKTRVVSLETGTLDVMESVLESRASRLLVWKWYWIGGVSTVSPYYAKLLELSGKLSARPPPLACGVAAYTAEGAAAASRMEAFLSRAVSDIETSLAALGRDR
jgi:EpsI family protein